MGIPDIDQLNEKFNVKFVEDFFKMKKSFINERNQELRQWFLFYFDQPVDVEQLSKEYAALSDVLVAEPIPVNIVYKTPDNPRVNSQWHINHANDADINAFEGWDMETGDSTIIVAVMDTGMEWWHADLAGSQADKTDRYSIHGNIWINRAELANQDSNVDEDDNGYADDWCG